MPSRVSMKPSSRNGWRASRLVSAMIRSSLPRFLRQRRPMSRESSEERPSQPCSHRHHCQGMALLLLLSMKHSCRVRLKGPNATFGREVVLMSCSTCSDMMTRKT